MASSPFAPRLLALLAVLVSSVLFLQSAAVRAQSSSLSNASVSAVLFHDPNTAVTYRQFSSCAVNVHQIGQYSSSPYMMAFGGADVNYNILASYDLSTTGSWDSGFTAAAVPSFNYTVVGYSGCNPMGRVAGGGAWLSNGNLVIAGGKACTGYTGANDVIYSTNLAASFSLATQAAPWSTRSDFGFAVAPNTNVIVLVGGTDVTSGNLLNDVWMSSDGIGAVWTLQTAAASFSTFQEGALTFMFDAASNSGGLATLVLYNPTNNAFFTSTNYGSTWTQTFSLNSVGIFPNQDARLVCGAANDLYMAGGEAVGSNQILYSGNKGVTWSYLNNQNWSPNISNSVAIDDFTYGCLAIRYVPSSTSPYGYHDQLVMFAGNITVDNLVSSGYNCLFDTGTQTVTSLVAEIIQPNEVYSLATSVAPSGRSPQMIYHDAGQWLTYRLYADCAYDVHQAVRKTSGTAMWQLGGFTSSYAYINSIDYTSTGSWLNLQEWNKPTYSNVPSSGTPSGRVAAGAGLLVNGVFLYFGGKDNASAVYVNDVYSSTNNGQSFTYVGQAQWSPRSDFAYAVMPMTNAVVVLGGMFSATGAATGGAYNDIWMSSDGAGAVWTQVTAAGPFPPFTDAAFTALYDSSAVNSSYTQQYSTLILYTGGYEAIFKSTNGGSSWTTAAAPWSLRSHAMFVADADNYVYFTGGSDQGDLWFSWNSGTSWINVNTAGNQFGGPNNNNGARLSPSSVYQNLYQYAQISGATGNCMAVRYTANPNSPNGFHKSVVLYGGANTIGVANSPSPSCVQQVAVNVLYAEVMFPSELANSAWTDTAMPVVPSGVVPSVVFNSPTVLLTYRQYPTCAYNVHQLTSHPSAPAQYILGGWDQNNNVLSTYDYVQGSSYSSYQYVNSWGRRNQPPSGRTAAGAAVLSNGNLLWFGGKTNSESAANTFVNDVWYESTPSNGNGVWTLATAAAPWYARSDMSVAAMPGTNCVVIIGGTQLSGASFNDVWASCDGYGQTWTLQGTGAWYPVQQGALVALFDGTAVGGSQANSTLIYYPAYNQLIYTSTNGGVTWTTLGVAPWSYRTTAKFIADAESNLYLVGGEDFGSIAADDTNALGTQSLNDVWYSSNKGQNWYQMPTVTNSAYSNPVQPSSFAYSCAFINYASGGGPQGYHRQITILGGYQQVYSTALQLGGSSTYSTTTYSYSQCVCDEISGVRAVSADLIFPGETVSSSSSASSSSSSKTYSPGATAGIAVGVAVAAIVLTSMVFCCIMGVGAGGLSMAKMKSSNSRGSKKFQDDTSQQPTEPSQLESDVEMQTGEASSPR